MKLDITDETFFNIMNDWNKKEITSYDKGILIKNYIDLNHISQREFCRRFKFNKSTVQDWISQRQKQHIIKMREERFRINTIIYHGSRMLFLLSNKDLIIDVKTRSILRDLKSEIEKNSI